MRHSIPFLLIFLATLLPLSAARAQTYTDTSPLLQVGRNGPLLELTVPAETNAGVLLLWQANDLVQLLTAPSLALVTNAPVTDVLRLPLSPSQRGFYYAIRKAGGALADFILPEIPDEPSAPYALWTLGLPTNLVSGVSYIADFLLVLSTNQLAAVSTIGQLAVVRAADGQPHPDAQITPTQIAFVSGASRTNVQVMSNTALTGYVVAVSLPNPTPTVAKVKVGTSAPGLVLVPVIVLPDSPPIVTDAFTKALEGVRAYVDTPGWSSPVPVAQPEVAGTFGEWRGQIRTGEPNANYHAGLDLVVNAGTTVSAARGGIVRKNNGSASGRYVTVDHLDGWYSRYLHLAPGAEPPVGSYVKCGARVGVVATSAENGGLAVHTHFELRSGAPGSTDGQPGIGLDPLRQAGMFAVRSPQAFSTLYSVGVTPNNPASQLYQTPNQPMARNSSTAYVVLKIKHPENGRRLAPQTVRFKAEDMAQFVELSTPDTPAIESLLPDSTPPVAGGFALYKHGNSTTPDLSDWFRYWFRWEVSGYASELKGPRTFAVQAVNYGGVQTGWALKWGPEILAVDPVGAPVGGEQRFRVRVRAWTGEDSATPATDVSAGTWATGADWLRYELPAGGRWVNGNSTVYEDTDSTDALRKSREQEFWWAGTTDGTNAQVTVRSRTVPAIADKKPINNMALIPAGTFQMGDSLDVSSDAPVYWVYVSAFYMDKYAVTKALWDKVYAWAVTHDYSFTDAGSGKAANHPVQTVSWYDCVKWCNARSEKEGRTPAYYTDAGQTLVYRSGQVDVSSSGVKWNAGYRLPTEAEWEKAARGGLSGQRFPWGNTISQRQANYFSYWSEGRPYFPYDVNGTEGYHPAYNDGVYPYTSPVDAFAANGYGLYGMAGNVGIWCWDWYGYGSGSQSDPVGPSSGVNRVFRGGCWGCSPDYCRVADRYSDYPDYRNFDVGFRPVLPPGQ